jgi:UDP-glucose 4-epimerase
MTANAFSFDLYRDVPVLVTGGMGFIGSNLVIALAGAGARVTVVDSQVPGCGANPSNLDPVRRQIEVVSRDIGDAAAMRDVLAGQQVIFNLAGEISHVNSMANPLRDLSLNVTAQLQFLDLCREVVPRATIVYASSRQVYGRAQYLPADEEHPINPADYNGVHKHATEQYHFLLRRQFQMRTFCVRLGNVYGPRQAIDVDCRGFVDAFVRTVLDGGQIVVYGDGKQVRGMTYVGDVVDAFLRLGLAGPDAAPVYNAGHPQPVSLLEIAQTLSEIAGAPAPRLVPFPVDRLVIDIGDFYQNTERIRRDFGWVPRVGLREGLEKTVAFFRLQQRLAPHADPHPVS